MGLTDQKLKYEITANTSQAQRAVTGLHADVSRLGGNFTRTFGGVSSLAFGAAGAIAGIASAASSVGLAIFNLTKEASDFGSVIYDASVKTGLGAVTLSSLQAAADQSGSSLETVTGGITKFAKAVGAAGEDAKKSSAFIKAFGIEPKAAIDDLDGALATVFKRIYDARPGVEQITLAQKAFGKSGADLIPIIQATGGDLEAFKKRCEELGLTISEKGIYQADQFGDMLETLKRQAGGVGRQFVEEMMPMMTRAMATVSDYFVRNQGVAAAWGEDLANTAYGTVLAFEYTANAITGYLTLIGRAFTQNEEKAQNWADSVVSEFGKVIAHGGLLFYLLSKLGKAYKPDEDAVLPAGIPKIPPPLLTGPKPPAPIVAGRAAKTRSVGDKEDDVAQREADEQERRRIQAARLEYQEETEFFEAEAAKRYAVAAQYAEKEGKTENDLAKFKAFLESEVLRDRLEKLKKYRSELKVGTEEYDRAMQEIRILNESIETQKAEAAKSEQDRNKKTAEEEKKLHDERRKRWSEHVEHMQKISDMEDAEADRRAAEEAARRRKWDESQSIMHGGGIGQGIAGGIGVSTPSIFDNNDQLLSQADFMKSVYGDVADFAGNAIGSMVQGLADLATQWLITGEFSAAAAMRMAAGAALGIAFQAGFKAIFEYAEGLAAAARYDFASAALHFAAAKTYGMVALAAGAVGVGLGLGARAMGGGGGGRAGQAAGGGYGSGAQAEEDRRPYSRASDQAFDSGVRNPRRVFYEESMRALAGGRPDMKALLDAVDRLNNKIGSMRPSEVLTTAARQSPGLFGRQVVKDMKGNSAIGREAATTMGFRK